MSFIQKLFLAFLSEGAAKSMEAESRQGMHTCPCGYARSKWDLGGNPLGRRGEPAPALEMPKLRQVRLARGFTRTANATQTSGVNRFDS